MQKNWSYSLSWKKREEKRSSLGNYKLVKTEHAINLERIKTEGSARRLRQELSVNLIQAIFKMLFAAGGLGIGALMVLKGHHELGYFMVGVGTSSVAADAPRLIRAIRKD